MKYCCLIVFIFCTILSNAGIISGICIGTCGTKGVPCKETFGSNWTYNGKCCDDRPCCKFLKAPCVPETCPKGFKLLSNQTSSVNCYYTSGHKQVNWNTAADNCASTDGAYLWRPNTEQEANAVQNELNIHEDVWTGANDIDNDGNFTFAIENGSLSFNDLPFGEDFFNYNEVCVFIFKSGTSWFWLKSVCTDAYRYICEYKLRVCP
ncbi:tetranectin-like protein isoform X3 [Mytilus trossulus]|uniref:tetranectin-like protein isoform X3 n=1 Tax=Mytilus trossulus TaxID=6551 RepID=UPI003006F62F